jgi:hypothetical protein
LHSVTSTGDPWTNAPRCLRCFGAEFVAIGEIDRLLDELELYEHSWVRVDRSSPE